MNTTCRKCGKPFDVRPSAVNAGGNFCSRDCWYSSGRSRPARRKGTEKLCAICGAAFYTPAARPTAQYCGRRCKGLGSRLPLNTCRVCSKQWQPHYGQAQQPCCSRACGDIYRKSGDERQCEICNRAFYASRYRAGARFCSRECLTTWQRRTKQDFVCKICGKSFQGSPSRANVNKIIYCSIPCRDEDPERRQLLIWMNVAQQTGRTTSIERIGYEILDGLSVPYRAQCLIAEKFCVDAFFPEHQLVVQFDGDYWHGNPTRFPSPDKRQQRRIKLDQSQDAYLSKCGIAVIRYWETELKKEPELVRGELLLLLSLPSVPT
jgi:very-short-patch-repair endonuclease